MSDTSIPFMITAAMTQRLLALGVNAKTIERLTPAEAWTLLNAVRPANGNTQRQRPDTEGGDP